MAKDKNNESGNDDSKENEEGEAEKLNIRAQIVASENKVRTVKISGTWVTISREITLHLYCF